MAMSTAKSDSKGQDLVLERYSFEANGFKFEIKPITFLESWDFIHSGAYIPQKYKSGIIDGKEMNDREEYTEDELGFAMISLFKPLQNSESTNHDDLNPPIVEGFEQFSKQAQATVYWLQRKVSYNGTPIIFNELETKYMLTKGQIAKMLMQLADCSGFQQLQKV